MKGVELSYNQQKGVAFPFGFSGKAECVNESPGVRGAVAGGGGGGAGENPTSSWFGSISGHPIRGLLYENCPSLQPSYSGFHNNNSIPHTTPNTSWIQQAQGTLPLEGYNWSGSSDTSWIQQVQGTLPLEGYNWSGSSDTKDLVMRYPPCSALNAGSLVLDSSRGELVNALKMTPKEILEAKALAASKSHSEAERRRRERINSHLATLRAILPSSLKTDKASLLAEVIDQVKRLKRQVSDVYQYGSMPTESDELNVEKDPESGKGTIVIRASMCCDDRPDLMTDLKHTLDTLKLQTVKAEISTLGGRIKNVFVVMLKDDTAEQDLDMLIKQVQEALRLVMERPGRGELLQGKFSKRQRLTSFEALVDS